MGSHLRPPSMSRPSRVNRRTDRFLRGRPGNGSPLPGVAVVRALAAQLAIWPLVVAGAAAVHGQAVTVDCETVACHVVPIASGTGGFVGRARSGVDKVDVFMICRGAATRKVVQRELAPGADGLVSTLFGADSGAHDALACAANEDATIELRGLTDGGWYWLHDDVNTAIAPLMSKDVMGNRKIMPVNPGSPDILVEANRAGTASLLKQISTGRVGILPHVLPVPEEDVEPCGPIEDGKDADGSPKYVARETGCALGDGGTTVGLHQIGTAGVAVAVRGNSVTRPASGESRVRLSLWLNRTGSVVYGAATDYPPTFGWPGIEGASPLRSDWEVSVVTQGSLSTLESAGLELTDAAPAEDGNYRWLEVSASEDHCPATGTQHTERVRVRATQTVETGNNMPYNPVRPPIRHSKDLDGAAAEATFSVVCAPRGGAASVGEATMARELTAGSGLDGR